MDRPDPEPVTPELPPQRAAVLAFLRGELAAGHAPSLAEIALAFGFASRNAAQKHVQALLADGLLEQLPGRKRGLRLPGGGADLLPLQVLGRVAAGLPISAEGRRPPSLGFSICTTNNPPKASSRISGRRKTRRFTASAGPARRSGLPAAAACAAPTPAWRR